MPIDSSRFQRRSSRVRKTVDTSILSDVNTQKSNPQMDDSDENCQNFAARHNKFIDNVKLPYFNSCLTIVGAIAYYIREI